MLKLSYPSWLRLTQSCLLCDAHADHATQPLCLACQAQLPWLNNACMRCALPLPAAGLICGACQRREPTFALAIAPWRYSFPVDSLITRFKHQGQWPLGRLLGELLAEHLQHAFGETLKQPQLLVPVPLSRRRQRQRGFNQAQLLAQWLEHALQIPINTRCLQRPLDTPAQQGLDARTRRRNLRQAFSVSHPSDVAGLHVAIVDDVLTTGATADAMARVLRQAGARRVDVYCLARTPKPGD